MICSNCYETQISIKHDVGHWWNNPPDHVFVCSDECYAELEKQVKDGTWMDRKPKAIFGKKKQKPSPNFEKVKDKTFGSGNVMRKARESKLKAVTDKQFTEDV